jgi:nitronate monooxygenase
MTLPHFTMRNITIPTPIIQGGMGIGYANFKLAGTVANNGALGIISSAALDRVVGARLGRKFKAREACAREVQDAKELCNGKPIGINIMVATVNQYEDSVLGAMDGGVDVIISGAGLPIKLPAIAETHPRKEEVALVPIVSSARALKILIRKWSKFNRVPDAVVVEGPLAGGHIGWAKKDEALAEKNKLENLVAEVVELAKEYDIPVVAAGGIHEYADIQKYLDLGCAAVQMGTRFLATFESGASEQYKEQLVSCKEDDIKLADGIGSPCGLLFRVIKTAPFYQEAINRQRAPRCDKGYVLVNNECDAKKTTNSFCICNGLLSSSLVVTPEKELYTVGARAGELTEIISVETLMKELTTPPINDRIQDYSQGLDTLPM